MTTAALPGRMTRWLLPAALLAALLATGAAVGLLARRGRDQAPPRPGAFAAPAPAHPAVALDVQQVRGDTLTLGGPAGSFEVRLVGGVSVYALHPATSADAAPGDWVTVVGVANEVLNFAIRQVVIVPAALGATPDSEGVPRLPSALAGHEANRDRRERPLLAGRVERVDGQSLTYTGRNGAMTLDAGPSSRVQRLTAASPADIRAGDRIAYLPPRPGAALTDAAALLVLPAAR